MGRIRSRRLSPAVVLSAIALLVALSGTSFAAVSALAPTNSVGSPQVINGSLQTVDLSRRTAAFLTGSRGAPGPAGPKGSRGPAGAAGAPGATGAQGLTGVQGQPGTAGAQGPQGTAGTNGSQGPAGATGSQGPAGATGPSGLKGDKGDKGDRGPSDAYEAVFTAGHVISEGALGDATAFVTLSNLPAGDYLVTGEVTIVAQASSDWRVQCQLGVSGSSGDATARIGDAAGDAKEASLPIVFGASAVADNSTMGLKCAHPSGTGANPSVTYADFVATRVGALHP